MADNTIIFRPGDRITDAAGAVVSGAILTFFVAGTSTPLTVYSDSGLTVALGTSVTCDAGGYPAASGARVLIYTGTAAYKIVATTAALVALFTHDNISGAVNTSSFITSSASTVTYTVTPVTTTGTWAIADITGKAFVGNPSGGSFTRTLPTAASSTGKTSRIRHDGTSGIISLATQGTDLIKTDGTDTGRKVLFLLQRGDSVEFISDGVDWHAFFTSRKDGPRFFAVEDQRTAPAASPTVGLAYLMSGAPTGAFTSLTPAAAAGDILIYDGVSNYQLFRPTTNCGWLVFDKATGTNLQYRASAWVTDVASATVAGRIAIATQAQMEAETDLLTAASPGALKYHPGIPNAAIVFTTSGGVPTTVKSRNVTSLTDSGVGLFIINTTTAYSDGNVYVAGWARDGATSFPYISGRTSAAPSSSAIPIGVCNGANAAFDAAYNCVLIWGDFP